MNSRFEQGKKYIRYLFAMIVTCVLAALLFTSEGSYIRGAMIVASFAGIIIVFVIVSKYCRCPHCNKAIFFGVLKITTCPKCKRSLTSGQKVKVKK